MKAAKLSAEESKQKLEATPRVSRIGSVLCALLFVIFAIGDYGVSLILAKLFDIEVPFVAFAFVLCCSLLPAILELILGTVWGVDLSKRVKSAKQRFVLGTAFVVNLALIAILGYLRGLAQDKRLQRALAALRSVTLKAYGEATSSRIQGWRSPATGGLAA